MFSFYLVLIQRGLNLLYFIINSSSFSFAFSYLLVQKFLNFSKLHYPSLTTSLLLSTSPNRWSTNGIKLLSSASIFVNLWSLWVCIIYILDTICWWVLISMFLNSSIYFFNRAAKSVASTLIFLIELSIWVVPGFLASGLPASGAAAGLGFDVAGFRFINSSN